MTLSSCNSQAGRRKRNDEMVRNPQIFYYDVTDELFVVFSGHTEHRVVSFPVSGLTHVHDYTCVFDRGAESTCITIGSIIEMEMYVSHDDKLP